MNKKIILVLVFLIAVSIAIYVTKNSGTFLKGQILNEPSEETVSESAKPDLAAFVKYIAPEEEGGDIAVMATIENVGEGSLDGKTPFRYAVYVNKIEVFTNTDTFSRVEPGDSFSFTYPISRAIYQYPDSGVVRFIVDTGDDIKESDEKNNEAETSYDLGVEE